MSYNSIEDHQSMFHDQARNAIYRRALEQVITSDSVVLDLGAGLGIHGLIAARAGARKVYLVEPQHILEVTRRVVKDNGLANVELIQASAEKLNLPEKVDLIVSVFTGNFLLSEDLLPALFQARDRFLAPGGKLIPDRAEMRVAPVSVEDYHRKHIAHWLEETAEGFDYRAAHPYAANTVYYDSAEAFAPELLSEPATVMALDFTQAERADCDASIEVNVTEAGLCHGWLGWFRMRLGEEWLSTSPRAEKTHWCQVLLPMESAITVKAGDQLGFDLQRPRWGEWTWTTTGGGQQQRHSW